MKKIPVLLLALTMASMGSVMPTNQAVATNEIVGEMSANAYDKRVKFVSINPVKGSYDVYLEAGYMSGYAVKEMYVATFNYTKVTMAEADEIAKTLGEEASTSWKSSGVYRNYDSISATGFATDGMFTKGLMSNYPDVLYYAVKFVDKTSAGGEDIWVRGKLDYRACVHSKMFNAETGTVCYAKEKDGMYDFGLSGGWGDEGNEDILSWDDELTGLARAELETTIQKLENLELLKEQGQKISEYDVTLVRDELARALVKITALGRIEETSGDVSSLEARMESLLQGDDKNDGDGTGSEGGDGDDSDGDNKDDNDGDSDNEDGDDSDDSNNEGGIGSEVGSEGADKDSSDKETGGDDGSNNGDDGDDSENGDDDSEKGDGNESDSDNINNQKPGAGNNGVLGGNDNVADGKVESDISKAPNTEKKDEAAGVIGETGNVGASVYKGGTVPSQVMQELEINDEDLDNSQEKVSNSQEEIEIPRSGVERNEERAEQGLWSKFFWAIILAIIGGLGVVIWWVKKAFFADGEK